MNVSIALASARKINSTLIKHTTSAHDDDSFGLNLKYIFCDVFFFLFALPLFAFSLLLCKRESRENSLREQITQFLSFSSFYCVFVIVFNFISTLPILLQCQKVIETVDNSSISSCHITSSAHLIVFMWNLAKHWRWQQDNNNNESNLGAWETHRIQPDRREIVGEWHRRATALVWRFFGFRDESDMIAREFTRRQRRCVYATQIRVRLRVYNCWFSSARFCSFPIVAYFTCIRYCLAIMMCVIVPVLILNWSQQPWLWARSFAKQYSTQKLEIW